MFVGRKILLLYGFGKFTVGTLDWEGMIAIVKHLVPLKIKCFWNMTQYRLVDTNVSEDMLASVLRTP
jgi:hypothetical protein